MSILLLRKQSDKKKTFKWLVYDNSHGYEDETESIYNVLKRKFKYIPDEVSNYKLKWNVVGCSHDKISELINSSNSFTETCVRLLSD